MRFIRRMQSRSSPLRPPWVLRPTGTVHSLRTDVRHSSFTVHSNGMKIFGQHDEKTIQQFQQVREHAVDAALMADGHVGYVMPIGGVAAYRDQVSVVGVGFDIACGNAAIRTDLTLESLGRTPEEIRATLSDIADQVADTVSFGMGRKNRADDAPVDHALFDDPVWNA